MTSQARSEARFLALIEEYAGMLARIAAPYAQTPEDKADLIQEMRLQLWRALPSLDADRNARTWAYRVALNSAISWYRRARTWRPVEHEMESIADGEEISTEALVLRQLIAGLDPVNRALLTLHLEGLSNEEVGQVMGLTPQNVATKLTRLRQQLRSLINRPML